MRPRDEERANALHDGLATYAIARHPVPGIADPACEATLIEQLLESMRRIEFTTAIQSRQISPRRIDPSDGMFDPLRAALYHLAHGAHDEACWLVFLSVHFGKNGSSGWSLMRNVYGRLGEGELWSWENASDDPEGLLNWLADSEAELRVRPGAFGNHRKFESYGVEGTGATIVSYIDWVSPPRTHSDLFNEVLAETGESGAAFERLYRSMNAIPRFGRLARFDYLCMLGRLGLAPIAPATPYMKDATGPLRGARLLFAAPISATEADKRLTALGNDLGIPMQAVEDALCNWQKSPSVFVSFRG